MFAIYLYSRCVEEFPRQKTWMDTIMTSVCTCGKAIVHTGITLIVSLAPWYFISDLKFQAEMGFSFAMLLLVNMIMALTLHPCMIYLIKPNFISRGGLREKITGYETLSGRIEKNDKDYMDCQILIKRRWGETGKKGV